MTTMDCQTCNDLLLDLAYGELDEVRAAAVRRHAEGCADCTQALRRIERGRALARQLTPEEPPGISDAVRAALAAATAQPLAAGAGAIPAATATGSSGHDANVISMRPSRGVARWLDRVGELAMRRQVAMAAVFVVMLGVGLVFYQTHPRPSDTQDDRVPDVVPAVEVTNNPAQAVSADPSPGSSLPGRLRGADREETQRQARASALAAQPMAPSSNARGVHARPVAHTAGSAGGSGTELQTATPSLPSDDSDRAPSVMQAGRAAASPDPAAESTAALTGVTAESGAGAPSVAPATAHTSAPSNTAAVGWQASMESAQTAASRGDGPGALSSARRAMAEAPTTTTRAGIAQSVARILRSHGRTQEADELDAWAATVDTAVSVRASAGRGSTTHHTARRAAPASIDSASPSAPTPPSAGGASSF